MSKDYTQAGHAADELIAKEVALQDAMWGEGNERADATSSQIVRATQATLALVRFRDENQDPEAIARKVENIVNSGVYPREWSGFRDYGSSVANLVVAAAYLRNEIKRRVANGEDTTRSSRRKDQPYSEHSDPAFTTADPDWQSKVA